MRTTVKLSKRASYWELSLIAPDGKPPTLDFPVLAEFEKALETFEESAGDPARVFPCCLVISSSSGRCFCAGANIDILDTLSEQSMSEWVTAGHRALNRLEDLPIPVIAKVRGYALGGGLELAMACDLIVCDETAQLGLTEANIGFVPGWGGTFRLPRRVGVSRAKRMFYAAEVVDARSALSMGLVDELVEASEMDAWLAGFSNGVKSKSAVAISGFKAIVDLQERIASEANRLQEIGHSLECIKNEDTRMRIRNFLDKRKT